MSDEETFETLGIFTNLSERDSVEIRACFNVPIYIELLCPKHIQMACLPLLNCIVIHKHSMDIGLRASFHYFSRDVLSSLNIAPTKLSPYG